MQSYAGDFPLFLGKNKFSYTFLSIQAYYYCCYTWQSITTSFETYKTDNQTALTEPVVSRCGSYIIPMFLTAYYCCFFMHINKIYNFITKVGIFKMKECTKKKSTHK